jgi:predicted TIM-barrel fold metal-dependent hydrolase
VLVCRTNLAGRRRRALPHDRPRRRRFGRRVFGRRRRAFEGGSQHAAHPRDDHAGLPVWREIGQQPRGVRLVAHALGFTLFNVLHCSNWIINALPERFPKLKVMWIESGLTWAYSLMQRLDHSYMMRTSDCPSLKRKPSEYMREMFYSSQPMEVPEDPSILEATFKMIKADTQLVWSSDYPHWDFDLPGVIYDLPFLNETAKRNILGANAARLFNLPPQPVKTIPEFD